MKQYRKISSLLALLVAAAPLTAHQGHGVGAGHELWHFLTSPAHIIPAAVVFALTVAIFLFRRSRKAVPEKEYSGKD